MSVNQINPLNPKLCGCYYIKEQEMHTAINENLTRFEINPPQIHQLKYDLASKDLIN